TPAHSNLLPKKKQALQRFLRVIHNIFNVIGIFFNSVKIFVSHGLSLAFSPVLTQTGKNCTLSR
ncbi:hypothetical protein FLM9_1380, partial [Candidatus Synechococcus spongiarum]